MAAGTDAHKIAGQILNDVEIDFKPANHDKESDEGRGLSGWGGMSKVGK